MAIAKTTVSIIGCGWLGLALAKALVKDYEVKGSTTTENKLPILSSIGIESYLFDASDSILRADHQALFKADILIINIPPGSRNKTLIESYALRIQRLLSFAHEGSIKKIIYTSSTGVYDNTMTWVNEAHNTRHPSIKQDILLAAEEKFMKSDIPPIVLRLAGLAGPDREPGKWFADRVNVSGGNTPVNMVHQTDVVRAILTLIKTEKWPAHIYNICADEHPVKSSFYTAQSKKMGLTPATWIASTDPYKLVDNHKFVKDFSFRYQYPDPLLF
jgi:nucleoside-diphosphate-sugar epimerase